MLKNFTLIALMFILSGCLAADIALLTATVVPVPVGDRAERNSCFVRTAFIDPDCVLLARE